MVTRGKDEENWIKVRRVRAGGKKTNEESQMTSRFFLNVWSEVM